jgi:CDP-diacylglycerol--serine O-phosphatidyltransferase
MKQLPNIFTLLNLFFGCIAIVFILQTNMVPATDQNGEALLVLPEKMYWASLYIGIAAVIDFLDGLVARLLGFSSEMGKQLDSLADVVSFGVAPGMIIYLFLRLAFAQHEGGLDTSALWLLPSFIVPCAGAFRLARFNLDEGQTYGFKGVPIPAVGLLVASFPLIYWYSYNSFVADLFMNTWFWYAVVAIVSYLMICTRPMIALKFKGLTIKNDYPKFILVVLAVIAALVFHWLAVPVVFIAYVLLSFAMPAYASGKTTMVSTSARAEQENRVSDL